MTDLVIGVRIQADGSGLVGQLAPAGAGLRDVKQEAKAAAGAATELATATAASGKASAAAAATNRAAAAAATEVERAVESLGAAEIATATQVRAGAAAREIATVADQTAVAATRQVESAVGALGAAEIATAARVRTGAAARETATAAEQTAVVATRQVESAVEALGAAEIITAAQVRTGAAAREATTAAQQTAVVATRQVETAVESLGAAYVSTAAQTRGAAQAQMAASASAGQMRAGSMMLGQQIQDVGMQLAMGTDMMRVFAMQAGQTALAVQQMTGNSSRFAAFIGGPWGSAVLAAASIVGMLALSSDDAATSQNNLGDSADYVGRAQSALGSIVDLITGKFKDQNEVLREAIRLQALLAQQKAYKEGQEIGARLRSMAPAAFIDDMTGQASSGITGYSAEGFVVPNNVANPGVDAFKRLVRGYTANKDASVRQFRVELEKMAGNGQLPGLDLNKALEEAIGLATARGDYRAQGDVLRVAEGGVLPSYLRREGPKKRDRKPRTSNAAERLEEFGEDAADKIAGIAGRFSEQPKAIEQSRKALSELDDIIDDISRKKPLNMKELLADAEKAKTTVREGLIKGIAEPFEKQKTLVDQARDAMSALDEVAADFSEKKPPGWEDYLRGVEEAREKVAVGLARPYTDLLEQHHEQHRVQRLLIAGREDEAEALQIVLGLEKTMGSLGERRKAQILANVRGLRLEGEELDRIRKSQEGFLGAMDEVKSALSDAIADPLKQLDDLPGRISGTLRRLSADYLFETLFSAAFQDLEDTIRGRSPLEEASETMAFAMEDGSDAVKEFADTIRDAARQVVTAASDAARGSAPGVPAAAAGNGPAGAPAGGAEGGGDEIVVTGQRVSAVMTPRRFAEVLATELSEALGRAKFGPRLVQALGAAMLPSIVQGAQNGLQSLLGLERNGGSDFGLLGTIGFGAFKGTKKGSATIDSIDGAAVLRGNSSSRKSAAGALAEDVQQAIEQIAEALDGDIGAFSGSIGIRKKKFVVDPTGRGRTKGSGVQSFATEAEAQAALLRDAIADGAVKGLSAQVQRALGSNTDVDKALREALKVREIEELLSGGRAGDKELREFERQAAERVRIAREYGFDLVKLEEVNARDRAKVVEDILSDRIGALRDLLKDMEIGDLFEGSAAERRQKLLAEIAKAEADARKGVEGAADTVAALRRQLLESSREDFGTAGPEYAADRTSTKSAAEELIRLENERVKALQDATLETNRKLDAGNQLANEGNAIASEQLAVLRRMAEGGGGGLNVSGFLASTARRVSL